MRLHVVFCLGKILFNLAQVEHFLAELGSEQKTTLHLILPLSEFFLVPLLHFLQQYLCAGIVQVHFFVPRLIERFEFEHMRFFHVQTLGEMP